MAFPPHHSKWSVKEQAIEPKIEEFREQAAQEAQRQAQREAEERQRQAEASAQRNEWRDGWMEYLLEQTPQDASAVRLEIVRRIDEALRQFQPTSSKKLIKRTLDDLLIVAAAEKRDLDPYDLARRKVGPIKKLAEQVGVAPSTLCAYAQRLRGKSPGRPLKASTIEKIKAVIEDIAGHVPTR